MIWVLRDLFFFVFSTTGLDKQDFCGADFQNFEREVIHVITN